PVFSCLLSLLSVWPCFFFLLFRRPPCSTLFPYTTLFRSCWFVCLWVSSLPACPGARRAPTCPAPAPGPAPPSPGPGAPCRCCRRDRKSTRLNSSHVKISYAVFCLKKKNNTET